MALRWLCALLLALPGAAGVCSQPPRIVFAEPITPPEQSYPEGAVVKYRCRPGYVRNGDKSPYVTCLANSSWSRNSTFCTRKPCGQPHIENGNFRTRTDLLFGATVTFTCHAGYRLVGLPSAECVVRNGKVSWSAIPSCEIILCPPPPAIKNGQLLSENEEFAFGMAVRYSCNEGLSLIGEATIFCNSGRNFQGVWSGPAPECKEVKCENPEVINGKKSSGFRSEYTYGHKVSFECNPGYSMKGSSVVTCDANSTWTPPLPICDENCCGRPPEFPFASPTTSVAESYVCGTMVTYRCNQGFEPVPGSSSAVTCQNNTAWSAANPPSCTRQQCSAPRVEHGNVVGNAKTFPFEGVVTFTCNAPYKLKHSSATCVVAGDGVDWDPPPPYCKRDNPCTVIKQQLALRWWSCLAGGLGLLLPVLLYHSAVKMSISILTQAGRPQVQYSCTIQESF
ncbi:C4b-binding protein alpha chain-like isoform 1-T1 [Cyanocitta cristata]